MPETAIPHRAETLQTLRLITPGQPLLMLGDDKNGFGTRWTIGGQQIEPAIARYLMESGYVSEGAKTGLGAQQLDLTAAGTAFRERGINWWNSLSWWQKLRIRILG